VLYAVGELRGEMIVLASINVHSKILGRRRWYLYLKVGLYYTPILVISKALIFFLTHFTNNFLTA
jgi:hypothetical protein